MRTKKSRAKKTEDAVKAPTRQRILDAAFKTFLAGGYDRASTRDIASEAKVSKRELYAHFENKADLFAAGIKHRTEQMRVPLASPDLSSAAALARTLEAYGISLLTGVTHPHVLAVHRLAIAESIRSPELAMILDREGRSANVKALVALMRAGQEKNYLGAGEPARFARTFSALLWGDLFTQLLLRARKEPSQAEIARLAREATRAFLQLHGR